MACRKLATDSSFNASDGIRSALFFLKENFRIRKHDLSDSNIPRKLFHLHMTSHVLPVTGISSCEFAHLVKIAPTYFHVSKEYSINLDLVPVCVFKAIAVFCGHSPMDPPSVNTTIAVRPATVPKREPASCRAS